MNKTPDQPLANKKAPMNGAEKTIFKIKAGIATITLNQVEKYNAFDDIVIEELRAHIHTVAKSDNIRALVLKAEGKHFCAGADLAWMKRMAKLNHQENMEDAAKLATLMRELNDLPMPTIVRVQGAAYGGAIGLIACCDIAIASDNARFCLSEVKLGLAPATIGPYVVKAIGSRQAKKLFLTAEVFNAPQALNLNLVTSIVPLDQLDGELALTLQLISQSGPKASQAAKKLVHDIDNTSGNLANMTSELIASLRVSPEGQEGLSAFFEKRPASWTLPTSDNTLNQPKQ
jgi:methylglutaconyl-CoA hydratase